MNDETRPVDFGKLRTLMLAAISVGLGVLAYFLWKLDVFSDFQIGWAVLALGLAAIAWSAVFYFGCLAIAGSMTGYIVSDDTVIKGDNVELVSKTRTSGDARLDAWIDKFVFARNTFGMSVLPLLILIWLYFWG